MEKNNSFIKKCDICKEDAIYICFSCKQYFCESCYKFIHEKKANSNHKKENIDFFVPFDTKCKEHPLNPICLFCVDDNSKLLN